MTLFQNKYRIESNRLQSWDYGSNAAYFVTICTENRKHFFGEISNGQMQLSEIGKIAEKYWHEIPLHFPFIELEAFIVMPNHIHGIITINKKHEEIEKEKKKEEEKKKAQTEQTSKLDVSTDISTNISQTANASKRWNPATLGSIINQYKRKCTIESRKINKNFAWQPRFHDHIIRNNRASQNIKKYIIDNPKNWKGDDLFTV